MNRFFGHRLVFRADGNATIGMGHLVRLLALADILRGLAPGIFLVREPTDAVAQMLTLTEWHLLSLPANQSLEEEADWLISKFLRPADVLIVDGYAFTPTYQQRLRHHIAGLVTIDDLQIQPVVADILINHSPGIRPIDYQAPATTQLLLGPTFSLLRRPFLEAAASPNYPRLFTSVLVCFGGADPLRLTIRTLEALVTIPQLKQISIILGNAFGDASLLQSLVDQHPAYEIRLHHNISAARFVTLIQSHTLAVVPASTVLIEALVVGCAAITGYYANNQYALANYVATHQQAFSVGNFTTLTTSDLITALRQGLLFYETQLRQPYATELRPDLLRSAIQRLLS